MSERFFYIIAEGIQDLALVGRVLKVGFAAKRIGKLRDLPKDFEPWVKVIFPSIVEGDEGNADIATPLVPVPLFWRRGESIVVLRNAGGIDNIGAKLHADLRRIERLSGWHCAGVAAVVDSDGKPPEERFGTIETILRNEKLRNEQLPVPGALGTVIEGAPRVGVFALPEPGKAGTLEDVLLPLAGAAYPALEPAARAYIASAETALKGPELKEFKKPSGRQKATVSAIAAMLQPGKASQLSVVEDNWVSANTLEHSALEPLRLFLTEFLK